MHHFSRPPWHEWLDPHRTHEIGLMRFGSKRLAYIGEDVASKVHGEFEVRPFNYMCLVYRAEDVSLANMWERTYRLHNEGKISRKTAHARCGILLGYDHAHIRTFLIHKLHERLR